MKQLRKMACVLLCLAFLMTAGTAWGQEEGEGYSIIVDNMELRMGESMRYTLRDLAVEIQIGENSKQGSGWGALKSGEEDLFRIFLDYGESHSRVWLDGLDFYFDGQNDAELNELFYQLNGMEWTPEEEGVREELNFQEALEIDQRIAAIGQADLAQIYRGSVEYGAEHNLGATFQSETTVEIDGQEKQARHYKLDMSPEETRKGQEEYDGQHPEMNDYLNLAQNALMMMMGAPYTDQADMNERFEAAMTGDVYLAEDGSVLSQYHVEAQVRPGYEEEHEDYAYDERMQIAGDWIRQEVRQEDGSVMTLKLPRRPGEGLDGAECHLVSTPIEAGMEQAFPDLDWAEKVMVTAEVGINYQVKDGLGQLEAYHELIPQFPEEVDEQIAEERSELTGLDLFSQTETEQYRDIIYSILQMRNQYQVELNLQQKTAAVDMEFVSGGVKSGFSMEGRLEEIGFEDIQQPDWSSLEAITLENAEDKQEEWDEAFSKWSEEVAGKMAQNDALSLFMPEVIDTEELP